MLLWIFDFLKFSITDALDILMVGLMIFFAFRWIRQTTAMNIFLAIFLMFIIGFVTENLNMKLMSGIMKIILNVGVIALIVIFQPEIRHFLNKIGGRDGIAGEGRKIIDKVLGRSVSSMGDDSTTELIEAVKVMAEQKTGALIVVSRKDSLRQIIETGDTIDAIINMRLLLNLFFKNSPLHDGAVILNGDRIVAARCTLPLTGKTNIPARFGMRHKAAIGISEECDAAVIVVSEETGGVSFVKDGQVRAVKDIARLRDFLAESDGRKEKETTPESEGQHD